MKKGAPEAFVEDLPKLFRKFDRDGDGELAMDEPRLTWHSTGRMSAFTCKNHMKRMEHPMRTGSERRFPSFPYCLSSRFPFQHCTKQVPIGRKCFSRGVYGLHLADEGGHQAERVCGPLLGLRREWQRRHRRAGRDAFRAGCLYIIRMWTYAVHDICYSFHLIYI